MTLSQALEAVNKAYVPGVVAHYGQMNPNPWQQAHDDLERIVFMNDPGMWELGAEKFVRECKRLIQAFQSLSNRADRSDFRDGFYMGDVDRVSEWHSRKHKYCLKCQGTENLQLKKNPKDEMGVVIVCKSCAAKVA